MVISKDAPDATVLNEKSEKQPVLNVMATEKKRFLARGATGKGEFG